MWNEHEPFGTAGILLLFCSQVGQETEGQEEERDGGETDDWGKEEKAGG